MSRNGSGSQPVPSSSRSASGHFALLEVIDQLCRLLAPGFSHRFKNARLGHAAKIVFDRGLPTNCHHVERDCIGKPVGLSDAPFDRAA